MVKRNELFTKSVTAEDFSTVTEGNVIRIHVPYSWPMYSNNPLPPNPPPYWTMERDVILRSSIHQEAFWAGAIGIAISKMVSSSWEIRGDDPERIKRSQEILLEADGEKVGWVGFLSKQLRDYLTTDNGCFIEIVRKTKAYGSEIVGLRHLDSLRSTRTGDPMIPLLYRDKVGQEHMLRDHQVMMFSDMPEPSETYFGIGFCAASRAYRAIYKLAVIENYLTEKVTGMRPLAIHIVSGVLEKQLQGAVKAAESEQTARGLVSYMGAVIIGIPEDSTPGMVTIPLAEIPDRFNRREEFDLSVLTYANALGLDPQDLQPLTGAPLGTGAQSVILQEKSKGKGLVSWRQDITHSLNNYVLPESTQFVFTEKDYRDLQQATQISSISTSTAAARITAGITDAEQERRLLVEADELPKYILKEPMPEPPAPPVPPGTVPPNENEKKPKKFGGAQPESDTSKPDIESQQSLSDFEKSETSPRKKKELNFAWRPEIINEAIEYAKIAIAGGDSVGYLSNSLSASLEQIMGALSAGAIDTYEWESRFSNLLQMYNLASALAGTENSYNHINNDELMDIASSNIVDHLEYLSDFAKTVRESISAGIPQWDLWKARSRLYGDSVTAPYNNVKLAGLPLPAMPGDGTSQCLTHCKCNWEVYVLDRWRGDYDAYWKLSDAEHCQTCVERAARWNPLIIREKVIVN